MNPSLISVVIAVYNGELYLREALESVLRQACDAIEVIVIDDGSTDGTARIAKAYDSVLYTYQPNSGVAVALNRGIQLSRGRFLAFLDADDVWTDGKLSLQLAAFDQDPTLDAVFGDVEQFTTRTPGGRTEVLQVSPGYLKGAMLIKREAFFRVGLFEPLWRYGDFIEWFTRAQDAGLRSTMIAEVVLRRRIHADNMGIREKQNTILYTGILKAALDRRRKLKQTGNSGEPGDKQ